MSSTEELSSSSSSCTSDYEADCVSENDLALDGVHGTSVPYLFQPLMPVSLAAQLAQLDVDEPEDPRSASELTPWCLCGECSVWQNNPENVCCHEIARVQQFLEDFPENGSKPKCITHDTGFKLNCLEPWVLRTAYWQYRTEHGESQAHNEAERFRYTAYRQFVRLVFKFLGKEIRIPLPSCVYKAIRGTFPDSSGNYTGFLFR